MQIQLLARTYRKLLTSITPKRAFAGCPGPTRETTLSSRRKRGETFQFFMLLCCNGKKRLQLSGRRAALVIQWTLLPCLRLPVETGWRTRVFFYFFRVNTYADPSVPSLPSWARLALRSWRTLKIPRPLFNMRRPNSRCHGNTHISQSSSRIIKLMIVTNDEQKKRKEKKKQ